MSIGVTAAEITMSRVDMQMHLTHRCTIQRRTATSADPYGETQYGPWFNNATGVPCLLYQETGPGEQQTPERASLVRGWSLMLPATTDITNKDQIVSVANILGETVAAGPLDIAQVIREDTHLIAVIGALS